MRLFDLSRHEADVGIRFGRPKDTKLVARKLGRSALAFYASKGYIEAHGRPTGGWAGHSLIEVPRAGSQLLVALKQEHGTKARVVLRVNSVGHILTAVLTGIGIGLIQCVVADALPDLQRITPTVLVDELWAVSHIDARRRARTRALVDYLAEIVKASARQLDPRH